MTHHASAYLNAGKVAGLQGNAHATIAPYETLPTADGYINIGVANDRLWQRLCEVMDLPQLLTDPRFGSNQLRVENRAALKELIRARFARSGTAELVQRLSGAGVPADAIKNVAEVFEDPQVQHLGMRLGLEHSTCGHIEVAGLPYLLSETPATARLAPPTLGQHNDEVLLELGYGRADIERFRHEEII